MKTTLHYIIAILLFSLNATHAFAEGEKEPFNITKDNSITYSYNTDNTLLTIVGGGSITITGDGKPVECGIVVEHSSTVYLTIKDLYIRAEAPLEVHLDPNGNLLELTLEGTNKLESTQENVAINSNITIQGSGSLTVQGVNDVPAIDISNSILYLEGNPILVAIGGKDAEAICGRSNLTHNGGLLIQGHVTDDGGTIEQISSELKGNLTLGTDFEIPSWANVTIPAGQSITVPTDKTLTNKGSIVNSGELTNNGSIVNEGTLETEDGTLVNEGTLETNGITTNNKFLNIGGEDGFDVSTNGDRATFSYDGKTQLLTISGGGENVLIKGKNKDNPVDCGIVIACESINLTIEDLNIRADNALVFEGNGTDIEYIPILIGTNRLESTQGPGISSEYNHVIISNGSLTVIGGNTAYGIQGKVYINYNACVVAIGGKEASAGINPYPDEDTHTRGLLISGTKQAGGSINQDYSELKGDNITLGGNLEIPEGATVTIADGQTFTIAPNVTLTNNGTIKNGGTINNEGTLAGAPVTGNQPQHLITFKANDSGSTADVERYITEGETLPTDIFTRSGYTFQGWFTDPDGGTKVETVTRAQTLYALWEADEPAVEPEPPYIPPVPIYYNVYLPQVEGASIDPGPGEYEVESWSTFRFYLTIDSAYSDSHPVVTTDRGETLVPRSSDGAYLVKYVRTDVEVFIDGLIQNPPPVANEAIGTDGLVPQIWAEGSMLCIRMAEALPSAPVRIFTVDGRLYNSFASTPGLNRRQLPTGIYIVRVGNTACKVIIK